MPASSSGKGMSTRLEDMPERSGFASWVPQLFYDLISRVMPGALLLIAVLLSLVGPDTLWKEVAAWLTTPAERSPSTFLVFTAGIASSYFAAILVRGLSYSKLISQSLLRWPRVPSISEFDYRRYYRIKVALPAAGSRLAKHKAEASMATVLQLGFLIAAGMALGGALAFSETERLLVAAVDLLLAWSASRFRSHLTNRFKNGVLIHWDMLLDLSHPLGKSRDVR